jgi:hypothetical protein
VEEGQDMLAKYNLTYKLIEEKPLPNLLLKNAADRSYITKARAQFGFFNASADNYFIISRTYSNNSTSDKWAITTIPVI